MATNYEVNYDDERFAQVETDKQNAMNEVDQTYNDMIDKSDGFYQAQIEASQQWADKQTELQKEQHAFDLEQIEQQKQQAEKDYKKEQSGAYVDWQKQSNQYGANAEKMAQGGMTGTGFSESSQVSMYNTYQNRVATARETFSRTILQYDNNIKEARLQNNSILAEIAFKAQQEQLALSLEGFQYKNQLVTDQMNKKMEVDQIHHQRWQDVLGQINTENAMAEEVRQFNESQALEREKYEESIRQFNEQAAIERAKIDEKKRQFDAQQAAQKAQINKTSSSSSSNTGNRGVSAINKDDKPKDKVDNSTPTNNTESIMKLGYGPISASRLAELLASGQVTRTLKNGQYYYSRNYSSNLGSSSVTANNRLRNMGLSIR
jgi:hypothetical protein